jgi:Uncharacterized protein conserved in bacteria (DUF2213)
MHGDELDVAEMIRDGDLPSPQNIGQSSLFKIRITGVGYAYRPKHDEYVYRRPEHYLTPRFLDRCKGLFVIWEHPGKAVLNSQEFAKRVVGGVTGVVFIEGDEVWAIARIADKTAIREMTEMALSTSPSVVFRDPAVNMRLELEDGSQLLVEGPASFLDHVAICRNGVWDKEDGPTGVVANGVRADEFSDEALTQIADAVDGFEERMNILAILQRLERGGAQISGAR